MSGSKALIVSKKLDSSQQLRNEDFTGRNDNILAFTLIELSIVLMIISFIVGMAVSSGVSVVASSRIVATNQKITAIDQALLAFRNANDRIPCPSDLSVTSGVNYGKEGTCTLTAGVFTVNNALGTAVAAAEGGVPSTTLGLPSDFMYDGWGNRIRYAVDTLMTQNGAFTGTQIAELCGAITIKTGSTATYPATITKSTGAIYAIISHGPNGHGAYTRNGVVYNSGSTNSDELTNCHCTSNAVATAYTAPLTYVQEPAIIQTPSNKLTSFDDIVAYKERWQMQAAWDKTGATCPGIYVPNFPNNKVLKLDMNGNELSEFGAAGTTDGPYFNGPNSLAFDSTGNIYVADQNNNRVEKLRNNGTFVFGIGAGYNGVAGAKTNSGYLNGQFNAPTGVAVDKNQFIWVSEKANNRVQKFDNTGKWVLSIGNPSSNCATAPSASPACAASSANGGFSNAYNIAVDSGNNIWVTDLANNRVQKFDNNGKWILSIGGPSPYTCESSPNASPPACAAGSGDGQFNWPEFIAVDRSDNIWVSDNNWGGGSNNRVEEFSNTGQFIRKFTISGPEGIGEDIFGNIWVISDPDTVYKCTPAGTCSSFALSGSHTSAGGIYPSPAR